MIDILSLFDEVANHGTDRYFVRCPAHDDDNPSLDILIKDDRILLRCWAGCKTQDILNQLRIGWKDLFRNNELRQEICKPTDYYDYRDEEDRLIYQSIRYRRTDGSKFFRQRRLDGLNWVWNMDGVQRILYRLPDLIRDRRKKPNSIVFVVEGEKDVESLRAGGLIATTLCGGSKQEWLDSYSITLRGASVCLIPDNDEPGLALMDRILGSLIRHGVSSARLLRLDVADKGDVSDWLEDNRQDHSELYRMAFRERVWTSRYVIQSS